MTIAAQALRTIAMQRALIERLCRIKWRDEMNAVNFLSRSLADAKLTDALERADCWIDSARPVIKAYLELDQIDGDLCLAGHAFQNDGDLIGRSATDEARRLVDRKSTRLNSSPSCADMLHTHGLKK